ncbi:hypothetical protein BCR39DRAFT_554226 [Naematelia encephala]|uniref:Uncharacterized protein n=1 Tax=Naematelia encephala TaxID=71784 RepID=A0A1Y2AF50_9TREE|nr:hypothetical protein BCR39DRAFT_554226 [Naematelia encephala]
MSPLPLTLIIIYHLTVALAIPTPDIPSLNKRDDTDYVDKAKQLYQTNPGACSGIALGCAAVVAFIVWYFWRRRKRQRRENEKRETEAIRETEIKDKVQEQLFFQHAKRQHQFLQLMTQGPFDDADKRSLPKQR